MDFRQVAYDGSPFSEAVRGNGYEGGEVSDDAFDWLNQYCKATDPKNSFEYGCLQRLYTDNPDLDGLSPDAIQEFVGFIRRACSRGSGDCQDGVLNAWRTENLERARPLYSPDEMKQEGTIELTFRLVIPGISSSSSKTTSGGDESREPTDAATDAAGRQEIIVTQETCFALQGKRGSSVTPTIGEIAGYEFVKHRDFGNLKHVVCQTKEASASQPGDTIFLVKWLVEAQDAGQLDLEVIPILRFDDGYFPKHTASKPVALTVVAKPTLAQMIAKFWAEHLEPWKIVLVGILSGIAAIWAAVKKLPGFAWANRLAVGWLARRRQKKTDTKRN
ncbi:hypothetical protein [Pontixanthobacter sp. CEM42]|uniref:hypothetical protein n=1 Tax=Pontixanthobacter sp. CEM42 TaxID=2792077 RepID=UPI001ADFEA7F|nr:hypothetical protein [Pontixanthobacter sp. CEM42]